MDSDFVDPITLTPYRRPVVFGDCCLELYSATCLTATRLTQLGLPWPKTTDEVMGVLFITPSPLTRMPLGQGVVSAPIAQMLRGAAQAAGRYVAPVERAALVKDVTTGDLRNVAEGADALAMDLVTGHATAADFERVLAILVSTPHISGKSERLSLLASAILERTIEPDVDAGSCGGGIKGATNIFQCMCEAWLLYTAAEKEATRQQIESFFSVLVNGIRSTQEATGTLWTMLYQRRRQFMELVTPAQFANLVSIADKGLVSKDEWLLFILAERVVQKDGRALEWARAGTGLLLRMLRPDATFAPTSSHASILFATLRAVLKLGTLGDSRMPELLATALRRNFVIERMVGEKEEWTPILRHHTTDDIVPQVLAALVRFSAFRRRSESERMRTCIIDTLAEMH